MKAIILCGGRSSRMGRDKAFIEINGRPAVRIIYDSLAQIFDEVALSVKQGAERYNALGYRLIEDKMPETSSLVGIYSALSELEGTHIFVVACDLPLIEPVFINAMKNELAHGYDVVVPVTHNGIEPLYGFYSRNCLGPIREQLSRGGHKIIDFYSRVKVKQFDVRSGQYSGLDRIFSFNLNTPADLERLLKNRDVLIHP